MGRKRVAVALPHQKPPRAPRELIGFRERAVLERVPELAVVLDGVAVAEFTGSTRQSFICGQLPFQDGDRDFGEAVVRDVRTSVDRNTTTIIGALRVDVA